jgi:hypothetical protein
MLTLRTWWKLTTDYNQELKTSRVQTLKNRLAKVEAWHEVLTKEASKDFSLFVRLKQIRSVRLQIQQQLNSIYNYDTIREIERAN